MFSRNKQTSSDLDEAISAIYTQLTDYPPESSEYAAMADQIVKLQTLKAETSAPRRVSPDTLAVVLGNLAGIFVIVIYEREHVLTTKAMSFLNRSAR